MQSNKIFEVFKKYYPLLAESIVSIKKVDKMSIQINYKDDSSGIFDMMFNTFRYIPSIKPNITKEKWGIELGGSIYREMVCSRLTLDELSFYTGISETSLSKYINGQRIPSSYNLSKIARALGIDISKLLKFEEWYE